MPKKFRWELNSIRRSLLGVTNKRNSRGDAVLIKEIFELPLDRDGNPDPEECAKIDSLISKEEAEFRKQFGRSHQGIKVVVVHKNYSELNDNE